MCDGSKYVSKSGRLQIRDSCRTMLVDACFVLMQHIRSKMTLDCPPSGNIFFNEPGSFFIDRKITML